MLPSGVFFVRGVTLKAAKMAALLHYSTPLVRLSLLLSSKKPLPGAVSLTCIP
jgi:hypothetical protein